MQVRFLQGTHPKQLSSFMALVPILPHPWKQTLGVQRNFRFLAISCFQLLDLLIISQPMNATSGASNAAHPTSNAQPQA
jgi:hypothetical protein